MIEVLVKEHKFLDEKMNWIVEKGAYIIMIGNSSKNLPKSKCRNRVVVSERFQNLVNGTYVNNLVENCIRLYKISQIKFKNLPKPEGFMFLIIIHI